MLNMLEGGRTWNVERYLEEEDWNQVSNISFWTEEKEVP
jgi:hypothetical protein